MTNSMTFTLLIQKIIIDFHLDNLSLTNKKINDLTKVYVHERLQTTVIQNTLAFLCTQILPTQPTQAPKLTHSMLPTRATTTY